MMLTPNSSLNKCNYCIFTEKNQPIMVWLVTDLTAARFYKYHYSRTIFKTVRSSIDQNADNNIADIREKIQHQAELKRQMQLEIIVNISRKYHCSLLQQLHIEIFEVIFNPINLKYMMELNLLDRF